MEKDLNAVLKEIEEREQIRKTDEEVQALNARIDEAEQRITQMEVDKQIRDSIKADEGYFTTS